MNWRRENLTLRQLAKRFDGERFGQSRHAFEQDVAVGEQSNDQPFDQISLANNDIADLRKQGSDESAGPLDLLR